MILIFGATGNVGRHLVRQLTDAGHDVRAITRKPDDAALPPTVDVRFGDLDQPDTLPAVLDGADAVFLLNAGSRPAAVADAIAAADVRRVVFMSALVARTRPDVAISQIHLRTEDALQRRDLGVTVLQPGQFASNALQWSEMIARGTVYSPFADTAIPTIDPYDVAAVAALVLTAADDHHVGQTYPLTGPAISPRQRTAVLAEVLDRPIGFAELTAEQARQQMLASAPPAVVDSMLEMFGAPSAVEREELRTVQELLGRAPRDFAAWVRENRDLLEGRGRS